MKLRLLDFLACPECAGILSLDDGAVSRGDEAMEGTLACGDCPRTYEVRGGIPRLLPDGLSHQQRRTAAAFGWQWRHFVEMHAQYEEQFLDWIHPLGPESFRGKIVLDAGCGIGRHTYFASRYGAAEVIAFDLSDAVETAQRVLAGAANAHVVQADIFNPPFRRDDVGGPFDVIYSIGVLHHLPEPAAGFSSLTRFLRPGGTIFAWVYGFENNALVRNVVTPLRTAVTSKLPPSALRVLAWPLAVMLQAVVKIVYRPLRRTRIGGRLPMADYLVSISGFSFRQNYSIVFDHLVAPIAAYLRRSEFLSWFEDAGLEAVELSWRNRNSWRGRGRRPASEASVRT